VNADAPRLRLHVPSKTKLRQEWLQGPSSANERALFGSQEIATQDF